MRLLWEEKAWNEYCEKEDAIIIASCKGHYNG